MTARWLAFMVWALVAGSAVFWGMKLFVKAPPAPPRTQVVAPAAALHGDLARLFGPDEPVKAADAAPEPAAASRFQLVGVVAPRSAQARGEGLALIAVDGRAARAFKVGAVVDGENVLQSVRARGASLGPRGGESALALEIPLPVPAATGTLPGAAMVAPAGRGGVSSGPPAGQALSPRSRLSPGFNPMQVGALPLPGQGAAPPAQDGEATATDTPTTTR